MPEHISFYDLHQVIQTVFEWEDAHMHIFEAPKTVLKLSQMQEMHIPIIFWRRKFLFLLLQSVKAGFVMCMTWEMTGGINLPSKKEWKTMTKIMHFYGKRKGTVLQRIPAVSGMANK